MRRRGDLKSVGEQLTIPRLVIGGTHSGEGKTTPAGARPCGHEFHYSSCTPEQDNDAPYLIDGRPEGYTTGHLFASYMHLHFAGCPEVMARWLSQCGDSNPRK